MRDQDIINQTKEYVKKTLEGEGSGHDWWHIYRVWRNAIHISKSEKVNLFVVELAALLHDVADFKFHEGNEEKGPQVAREFLESLKVENLIIKQVEEIIRQVSFKGANVKEELSSMEAKIVRDADKLDAIGAIGVARAFAYGGKVARPLYDPTIKPKLHGSFEEYKKHGNSSTINHFYEKLLLLKNRLYTTSAKKIAEQRHKYMEKFLEQFYEEWEGKQ